MDEAIFEVPLARRYHEALVRQIARHIVAGTFAVGSELPSEKTLLAEFSVSRAVVREALRSLEQSGMIKLRQGKRAQINPEMEWDFLDPLVLVAFKDEDRIIPLLRNLTSIRAILEPEAAARAAETVTPDLLSTLDASITRMEGLLGDPTSFYLEDQQFHLALARTTDNLVLGRLMKVLTHLFNVSRPSILDSRDHPLGSLEGHREIAAEVAAGNAAGARDAMRRHIEWRVPHLMGR